MSERKPDYGDTSPVVTCPNCEIEIGHVFERAGRAWLRIGNLEVYAIHGRCGSCQSEWHWTASEVMLQKIVEKSRRKNV